MRFFASVLMVALMLTDEIPNPVAAIIACLLMGKFRCIDAESAYKAIHWPSIILIVGMMPFAPGATENRRGGFDRKRLNGRGRGIWSVPDDGLPVRHVRHHWFVHLQYRNGGADGAHCTGDGKIDGCFAVSVCDDGCDGGVRGIYDAGLFPRSIRWCWGPGIIGSVIS